MTYLAAPITGDTVEIMAERIARAADVGAEMLELRVDYLVELTTDKMRKVLGCAKSALLPVIVTCRDPAEGGMNSYSQSIRTEILENAIQSGADLVDCEFANFKAKEVRDKIIGALEENPEVRLILSSHDFYGEFDSFTELYDSIHSEYPQAVVKLVCQGQSLVTCLKAFELFDYKGADDAIVLCMGPAGLITRILAKKYGGFATFASIDEESASAPGQISIEQMIGRYRYKKIDADTEIFGVIGNPVAHSMSPAIFNASFDAMDMNGVYVPLLLEGQDEAFDAFIDGVVNFSGGSNAGFRGFSVTIPHKANALNYVEKHGEQIEPLAATIGAVNTLKIGYGGQVSGYNTDYAGAMDALTESMGIGRHDLHNTSVAVVGAGGVARAVVAGFADVGADVTIYNRTVEKACALAEEFGCKYASRDDLAKMEANVVVNCTSIGMHPDVDATPVPKESLKSGMVVFDTVYNPLDTLLLRQSSQVSANTVSGADMFVRQAMAQFKIFTGSKADKNIMQQAVLEGLGSG